MKHFLFQTSVCAVSVYKLNSRLQIVVVLLSTIVKKKKESNIIISAF